MENSLINRRSLIVGASAAAALLSLKTVVAQTASAGGNWFDMIKAQHTIILGQVSKIVSSDPSPSPQRISDLTDLATLLLSHNTAEENNVYPALASVGGMTGADVLYLEQSHGKIATYNLNASAATLGGDDWNKLVVAFQADLIDHAKNAEEIDFFPKLQAALTSGQNAALTQGYINYYNSVTPF